MLPSCSNSEPNSVSTSPLDKAMAKDTSSPSSAAMGFFLDREGHKKFLRTTTNQELESQNKELVRQLDEKTEECDYYYTEYHDENRNAITFCNALHETEEKLRVAERDRDHFKKHMMAATTENGKQ